MRRTKEVYPNAPLQFVAFEVRFPTLRRAVTKDGLDVLEKELEERFPIFQPVTENQVTLGPGGPSDASSTRWYRFLSTPRTTAVSVQPTRLVVETTHYDHYENFREVVALAVRALAKADRVPVFERIGLRYIDEIRVPAPVESPTDWSSFINPELLKGVAVSPSGTKRSRIEGVLRFDLEPSHTVIVRYGNLEGEVVGEGLLRPKPNKVRSGAFFLIDIDSFVEGQAGGDEFSPDASLAICDRLREPVREIFERCVTERLRAEVLRKEAVHESR